MIKEFFLYNSLESYLRVLIHFWHLWVSDCFFLLSFQSIVAAAIFLSFPVQGHSLKTKLKFIQATLEEAYRKYLSRSCFSAVFPIICLRQLTCMLPFLKDVAKHLGHWLGLDLFIKMCFFTILNTAHLADTRCKVWEQNFCTIRFYRGYFSRLEPRLKILTYTQRFSKSNSTSCVDYCWSRYNSLMLELSGG